MTDWLIRDGLPFRRQVRVIRTVRERRALANDDFRATAQTPICAELCADFAIEWHYVSCPSHSSDGINETLTYAHGARVALIPNFGCFDKREKVMRPAVCRLAVYVH